MPERPDLEYTVPILDREIRKAGVHGHDAFFCPECQPDARGSAIVDFRGLKR